MEQARSQPYKLDSTQRLLEVLFVSGIGLGPVYLFPSGLPQLGDWILASWAALALVTRPSRAVRVLWYSPVTAACLLVIYITLVNLTWAFYLVDWNVAFYALFYIYNFLVVWALVASALYDPQRWRRVVLNALLLACLVMLVMFFLRFDPGRVRQTAGFNNPNQLGYNSLLLFCAAIVLHGKRAWQSVRFWFLVGTTVFMLPFAASLGAVAGFGVALLGALTYFGRRRLLRLVPIALIVLLVLAAALIATGLDVQIRNQVEARLAVADRKIEDFFDERGYDRILEYPQYTILGAGEGARYRFGARHSHELHSTLGTVLFSYGIPGLTAFLAVIAFVAHRKEVASWFFLLAPIVYSLAHQGFRSTLFWILLFLVWMYGEPRKVHSRAVLVDSPKGRAFAPHGV